MKQLHTPTPAAQVHPTTRQLLATHILPTGTDYEPLTTYQDGCGTTWLRIVVHGYHYDMLPPKEEPMPPLIPLGQPPNNKLCENDALNLILDARDDIMDDWREWRDGESRAILTLAKLTMSVYRLFYPLSLIAERDYLMAQQQEF